MADVYTDPKKDGIRFLVSAPLRLVLLFLTWLVGLAVTMLAGVLLVKMLGGRPAALMRISAMFQDMLMWIGPALATAVIVTRSPARLLCIDRMPTLRQVLLAVMLLVVSAPLMSWIINLNAGMHLPAGMEQLESALRSMEEASASAVESMLQPATAGNVLMNILIIGVFAGFSEELFFRGTMQRLLSTSHLSTHAAIWITAVIFSAMHLQFFGFVPRMLLGAIFGYMLYWSGSLWLPILIHALNNSMFVGLFAATGTGDPDYGASGPSWVMITVSAALTALCIAALASSRKKGNSPHNNNFDNNTAKTE